VSKTTILIVEDEGIVAADLARKLEGLGYEVAGTAARGDEAVELVSRLRPDLVLMDIWLEGSMDGIEAAEAIRRHHDVPVVYLTAHSDSATLVRAKLTGPFGYVLKPFEQRDLATQIEMALYRHLADQQIRRQRELLRVTISSIGDAVIATDVEGRITFLNPVAESLTGWKAEEAAGQPVQCVFRIINELTGQPQEEPVSRVLREGRAIELANHTAIVTKDGRIVPIEDSAAPIIDAAGQVIGAVLVFHDVTEKRRAAEALQTTVQRFYSSLSNMYGSILLVTNEGKVEFANQSFCDLFHVNVSPQDLIGRTSDEIVRQIALCYDHPEKAVIRIQEIVGGEEPVTGEEVAMSDGRTCLRDFIPIAIDGKPYGRLWHYIDITRRKQAERAARASERRESERAAELAAMFDATPTPVFIAHDPDCLHITGNPAADALLRSPLGSEASLGAPAVVRPRHFTAVKDGRELSIEELPAQRAARGELVKDFEFSLVFEDGMIRHVVGNGTPLRDEAGQPRGSILVLTDITERKLREERIAKLTRLYAVLSRVNEAIVRARDVDALFSEVCQIVAEVGQFPLVWIGEIQGRRIVPAASAGPATGYLDGIQIEIDGPLGTGPGGTCIREDRAIVNDDFSVNHRTAPWREAALRFGFLASAAFPLHRGGKPAAELTLYARDAGAFDSEQIALLESLCADLSFALDALDREQLRVRAEEALRRSEEHFRAMAEALPQIVWTADSEGAVEWYNQHWYDYTGQPRDECLGWSWDRVSHADDMAGTLNKWQQALRTGSLYQNEIRVRRHDGQYRWFLVRAWPLRDAAGNVVRWFGTNTDVHDMKQVEKSLAEAKAAAEAANEAKGRFLANMSHELRTPMNAILGMIDVALPRAVDPTVKDCLQTAKGSADLLLTLLNDLLDTAKIESGKLELESAPFSLRRMLDQITRVLAVRASEKGLAFYCRMPNETPDTIVGDRLRLQQILLNLAGNAVKFTERGEVEIDVRVVEGLEIKDRGLEKDNKATTSDSQHPIPNPQSPITSVTLEFSVRDTGIGITQSSLAQLFQPFAQADASMTRRFGGTGLGLSIAKTLVEMMGGRIWVESEAGKGSTFFFTIRLPLAKELPADLDAPVASPKPVCGPLRVLLVEDNPANQKLATYILQDRGHEVEIAGDGQEAIDLAERNRYDVILMDVQMPGMNGLEATAAIREREAEKGLEIRDWGLDTLKPPISPDSKPLIPNHQSPIPSRRVPIIAMTAHAMKGDRDRCLAAGMDGYLSKPVNASEMIGLVESLAGEGREARESETDGQFAIKDRILEQNQESSTTGVSSMVSDSHPPIINQQPPAPDPCPLTPDPCPLTPDPCPLAPIFNPEEAIARCFNSKKMAREMIQCFHDEVAELFPQMRGALEQGDLVQVGQLGHRLKGTIVYLGAEPAKRAAVNVERFHKSGVGTPAEAAEAIDALQRECAALKAALTGHPLASENRDESR
jgi:PAS domain S-box-containing protein